MIDPSNLKEALKKLTEIENSKCVISIALFDKKVQRAKEEKVNIIRAELESKIYGIKGNKLSEAEAEINEIVSRFESTIDSLIDIYYEQQMRLQEYVQQLENDQKYVINDLLKAYLEYKKTSSDEAKELVIAMAQKKVNYDALIDECEARIEVNIDEAEDAINSLIEEKTVKIVPKTKDNFITRFRKIVITFFSTPVQNISSKFEDTKEKLIKVESFSDRKVKRVKYEILYFDAQISEALSMA